MGTSLSNQKKNVSNTHVVLRMAAKSRFPSTLHQMTTTTNSLTKTIDRKDRKKVQGREKQ